jgi:bacillopeptidase F
MATLTISAASGGTAPAAGSYPVVISGTADSMTRSTTATLVITDAAPPTVSAPFPRLYYRTTMPTTGAPVMTTWSARDLSGVTLDELQLSTAGGAWAGVALPTATTTAVTQTLTFGTKYGYQVRATDGAANTSSWVPGPLVTSLLTQQSGAGVTYGGTWHNAAVTAASGGSEKFTDVKGAWTKVTFTGSSIAWIAQTGPTRGSAAIYVDGIYKGSINLQTSTYHQRQIVFVYNWATNGAHSLTIVSKGTSGHARISVDAFVRLVQG